ncbi:MAG TPA: hypothetical protein DCX14_09390 [Flavobacteriales bacterium]|nr:hypothetical protein [Flavobacteriales bacterium]
MSSKCKILLSGGWGYSNLGDDAILVSSIRLIRDLIENPEITVISFDPQQTEETLCDSSIKIVRSAHRSGFGDFPYYELNAYLKSPYLKFSRGVVRRITSRVLGFIRSFYLSKFESFQCEDLDETFAQTDLFIMSGGGYFNSWKTMLASRMWELNAACRNHKKTIVIGQTLGPFLPDQFDAVKFALCDVDVISVRDPQSVADLQTMGYDARLSPDLALYDVSDVTAGLYAGIIPGGMTPKEIDNLVEVFKSGELKDFPIKLIVTRLYREDVRIVDRMKNRLEREGFQVYLCVHDSYNTMLSDILSCRFMVSRNLHGLILAYRAGVPILCVNNERKFIGFMEQIKRPEFCLNLAESTPEEISERINEILADSRESVKQELSEQVFDHFQQCLKIVNVLK